MFRKKYKFVNIEKTFLQQQFPKGLLQIHFFELAFVKNNTTNQERQKSLTKLCSKRISKNNQQGRKPSSKNYLLWNLVSEFEKQNHNIFTLIWKKFSASNFRRSTRKKHNLWRDFNISVKRATTTISNQLRIKPRTSRIQRETLRLVYWRRRLPSPKNKRCKLRPRSSRHLRLKTVPKKFRIKQKPRKRILQWTWACQQWCLWPAWSRTTSPETLSPCSSPSRSWTMPSSTWCIAGRCCSTTK